MVLMNVSIQFRLPVMRDTQREKETKDSKVTTKIKKHSPVARFFHFFLVRRKRREAGKCIKSLRSHLTCELFRGNEFIPEVAMQCDL